MSKSIAIDELTLSKSAVAIVASLQRYSNLAVRPICAGFMTYKYEVWNEEEERFVVRFYPPSRSFVVSYEPDLIKRCKEAGIRVAEIISDSRYGRPAPLQYMVYRMIPGHTMEERLFYLNSVKLDSIIQELITSIQTMSNIEVSGWGELDNAWNGSSASWAGFVRQSFSQGLLIARAEKLLHEEQLDALVMIQANLDAFKFPEQAKLVWTDISPEHIILDKQDHFTGLIDFEGTLAADALLNIGYFIARYYGTIIGNRILKKWTVGLDEEANARVQLYVVLRALRIFAHGNSPLPTGENRTPINVYLPGFHTAIERIVKWIVHR